MGVGLPATGTLIYNGVTFTGAMVVTASAEPVMDDAGRTAIYILHRIQVETIIGTAPGSTDATLQAMRNQLSKPGGPLSFTGKGFGEDLVISGSATKKDVVWGPKPKVLSWDPIGNNLAAHVVWSVEVAIPMCSAERRARYTGIMALNYTISFSLDDMAKTTRTITGHIRIAQTRLAVNSRIVRESADEYWEDLFKIPGQIEGFKRTHTRNISKDKSRLDFTITDTEIPSPQPYPAGAAMISATHSIRVKSPFSTHQHRLSMTISRHAGLHGTQSWATFVKFVQSRVAAMPGFVFMVDLEATEEVFGYESSFSARFRVTKCMIDIVTESGLYTPIPGTSWLGWAAANPALNNARGERRLKDLGSYDYIVDLCDNVRFPSIIDKGHQTTASGALTSVLKNTKPSEANSYISTNFVIIPHRRSPAVRQSTLQAPPTTDTDQGGTAGLAYPEPENGSISDTIQRGGQDRYSLTYDGMILRLGYPPVRPRLLTFGGQAVTETGGTFVVGVIANHFGVSEYMARWSTNYIMANSPGKISKIAPNDAKPKGKIEECLDEEGNYTGGVGGATP